MGDALAIAPCHPKPEGSTSGTLPFLTQGKPRQASFSGDRHHAHWRQDSPFNHMERPVSRALLEMSEKGLGMTAIIDQNQRLVGLFTDGDLRPLTIGQSIDIRNSDH